MPNYDYQCPNCETVVVEFNDYEDRDWPLPCDNCGYAMARVFITPPQVRTEKLSRTFVDGTKRKGFEDIRKVAELEVEKVNTNPGTARYHEIKAEIAARSSLAPRKKNRLTAPVPSSTIEKKK